MKKDPENPEPPELPRKESEPENKYEAIDGPTNLSNTVDTLLKSPGRLLFESQEGRSKEVARNLAFITGFSFLLFGFILGLFSGGTQLWAAPLKVFAGITVSALITLPSLYVFSCLGGLDMTIRRSAGLLSTGLALVGLVLLGLCPVAWIFSQSTDSLGFMGFLVLLFWITALSFGIRLIARNSRTFGSDHAGYLILWAVIFVTVTLQMSTSLRPLIGPAENAFLPEEKRFFLEHWVEVVGGND